jgi:hypothetical protein
MKATNIYDLVANGQKIITGNVPDMPSLGLNPDNHHEIMVYRVISHIPFTQTNEIGADRTYIEALINNEIVTIKEVVLAIGDYEATLETGKLPQQIID